MCTDLCGQLSLSQECTVSRLGPEDREVEALLAYTWGPCLNKQTSEGFQKSELPSRRVPRISILLNFSVCSLVFSLYVYVGLFLTCVTQILRLKLPVTPRETWSSFWECFSQFPVNLTVWRSHSASLVLVTTKWREPFHLRMTEIYQWEFSSGWLYKASTWHQTSFSVPLY